MEKKMVEISKLIEANKAQMEHCYDTEVLAELKKFNMKLLKLRRAKPRISYKRLLSIVH